MTVAQVRAVLGQVVTHLFKILAGGGGEFTRNPPGGGQNWHHPL